MSTQAGALEQNAPFEGQTKIVDVNDMPWQSASTPGIKFKVLYRDEKTGAQTLLLKFEPGAKTPLHQHTGLEQTFVLEGSLSDHDGTIAAGNFVWRQAGSIHQATSGPEGSLHIAFFSSPNRMLDGSEDDLAPPKG
jgi:anti-sigma factor ChrR (cupin superfamily)